MSGEPIEFHRSERLPNGTIVGFSEGFPDRQFLFIPKAEDGNGFNNDGGPVTGETENSDFQGIVFNAAVAAIDGCPWVEKGRVLQVAEGIAETVADRIRQADSFLLPDGQRYVRDQDLIEASSLGTPAARAFRESVSDEDVDRVMDRVNEMRRPKKETYGAGASDLAPSHTQKRKRRGRWHRS